MFLGELKAEMHDVENSMEPWTSPGSSGGSATSNGFVAEVMAIISPWMATYMFN